jgi:phosphate transport system permease protein
MSDLSDTANKVAGIRAMITRHKRWDIIFSMIGLAAMLLGIITLLALFLDLVLDGYGRLNYEFFTSFPSRHAGQAGILSAWVGTTLVMLVTALAGVPLGVAAGIYLEEYAPRNWMTDLIEINVTNLAGVPSIVYGLLALGLFVYQFDLGQSILAAGLTLALLILPVVIVATREAIRAVPGAIREAAYAVGATKWQTVAHHVLPYSTAGILTGMIIGMARAIGETAPIITIGALTFIAFLPPSPVSTTPPFVSFDWLFAPFTVLPIQMFSWLSRPQVAFLENAAAAGVVIIVMTLAMNAVAIWLRYRFRKRIKW